MSVEWVLAQDFLDGADSKESACNAGDPSLILVQEDSLEKETTPVFLPGESYGQRCLAGKESDMTEQLTPNYLQHSETRAHLFNGGLQMQLSLNIPEGLVLWIPCSMYPHGYQNPRMLKSFIYNSMVFTCNLHTPSCLP